MYFCQAAQSTENVSKGKTPFSTLGVVSAPMVLKACEDDKSNAHALCDGCPSWKRRIPEIRKALESQVSLYLIEEMRLGLFQ